MIKPEHIERFNSQFAEDEDERNERLRMVRQKRALETLWRLIADLSDGLRDEGNDYSVEGLQQMRRRVANALPALHCPEWLNQYRDPALTHGGRS